MIIWQNGSPYRRRAAFVLALIARCKANLKKVLSSIKPPRKSSGRPPMSERTVHYRSLREQLKQVEEDIGEARSDKELNALITHLW